MVMLSEQHESAAYLLRAQTSSENMLPGPALPNVSPGSILCAPDGAFLRSGKLGRQCTALGVNMVII